MDFFARQDAARRGTRVLVALFVAAMGAMAVAVHLVVGTLSRLLGGSGSPLEPTTPGLALIGLIWLTVLLGAAFRALDVRAGGEALAHRFGASPAAEGSRDKRLQRLSDTVAEMAIAAGVSAPAVRVLARERSINAFVLGGVDTDGSASPHRSPAGSGAVIVVSRGAIDTLDADELRGVIAHEMAHIAQGDLPLNMRLLVALGGLAALDEVGRTLIGRSTHERQRSPIAALVHAPAHPAALVGWLLRAFGSIGVLAGGLLRAAVSRGREYLADASAVQLTRQPSALASALATIRDADAPALHSVHAEELAHLCFHGGRVRGGRWRAALHRALASHPPLQSRIDAIDPHVHVKRRKRDAREGFDESGGETLASTAEPVVISDRLQLQLSGESDCIAALCALFAGFGARGAGHTDDPARGFGARLAPRVSALRASLRAEIEDEPLAVIERACVVLREIAAPERRRRFLLALEVELADGGELDFADYVTLRLLRRRLEVESPASPAPEEDAVRSFESMGEQFALLLSLLVESSGAPTPALEREFRRALRCYTNAELPRRAQDEPGVVAEIERAFRTLAAQPLAVRRGFVQHCTDIIEADGRVVAAERALIELIDAALDEERLAA